jgi:hypothetical protein
MVSNRVSRFETAIADGLSYCGRIECSWPKENYGVSTRTSANFRKS